MASFGKIGDFCTGQWQDGYLWGSGKSILG